MKIRDQDKISWLRNVAFCAIAIFAAGIIPAKATPVVIGVPSWASAKVTANVVDQLLREEFGLETELREQGTLGILAGIDKGDVHVHPEIWLPNLEQAVERYAYDNGTLALSVNSGTAAQNICTTKATQEQTGLVNVSDLADPEMAAKFDTNADGLGEIWIGAPTWSSTDIERVRAKSYGYDKTMSLLTMEEDVAMAAVDVAASLGKPIVFYCYSPHHVFRLHDIRILKEPDYDPEKWNIVAPADDPNWLEHSMAGTSWEPSSFRIGYAKELETSMPKAAGLLKQLSFAPIDSIDMSYKVLVDGIPPEEVASSWIAENREKISKWLEDTE